MCNYTVQQKIFIAKKIRTTKIEQLFKAENNTFDYINNIIEIKVLFTLQKN